VKILVLGWDTPATPRQPGSPRLFCLCRELCSDHELELLLLPQNPERLASFRVDPEVARVFSRIDQLPTPTWATWLQRQVHRLRQEPSFSRRALASYYARLCSEVHTRCEQADLLFVDGLSPTQYVRDVPVPAVVDLHDSLSLFHRRSAEHTESRIERWKLLLEARSIARWEGSLRRNFGLVITNSDVDRDEILRLDPLCNAIAIPNGVDTDYFSPGPETPVRNRLVFTGVMGYGPNGDAARFFIEEAMPLIREQEPDCEFWAVGHGPSESLQALDGSPGIRVTGSVPDVRPFVREARAFVCPLQYGTGMKNKILAAMSMGRPVLATSISLDGINVVPEEHVLVADSPAELARQSLRLMRDDELVARLCDRAKAWVDENLSWSKRAANFELEVAKLREPARP
jgi:glycosyltransferase involved in cell wall biosynthesis